MRKSSCRTFSSLVTDVGGPSLFWIELSMVVLGAVRKEAEQAVMSKPVRSTPYGLRISSHHQISVLFEFLSSLLFMMNCCMEL